MSNAIIKEVDREVARVNPDRADMIREVHRLTEAGVSAANIAVLVGLSARHVVRIRQHQFQAAELPRYRYDHSDQRAEHLEQLVDVAVELAVRMRDEDPGLVYEVLSRMDRQHLIELTQVCLAGIPIDQTKQDLWGWM